MAAVCARTRTQSPTTALVTVDDLLVVLKMVPQHSALLRDRSLTLHLIWLGFIFHLTLAAQSCVNISLCCTKLSGQLD